MARPCSVSAAAGLSVFLLAACSGVADGSIDDIGSGIAADASTSALSTVTAAGDDGGASDVGIGVGLADAALDATALDAASAADASDSWAASSFAHFYGGNAHWDYDWTAQQIADHLHQTHMTTVRFDTGGYDAGHVARVHDFAVQLAAIDPGLKVFVAITGDFDATVDEATNYAAAYAGALSVVKMLGPVGVSDFECGNERPSDPRVFPDQTLAGDVASQYASGKPWQAMRGAIRGMVDAVKGASGSYRAAVNFTIAQFAASDMLWNGVEPDGSTGHPTVRWDITSWHNYEIYGSPFHMGTNGHGSGFDLMGYIAAAYGKPIMITEWNSNPEDDDATKTAFSATWLSEAYAHRELDRIESTMIYQLAGGAPDFGLFAFPGQTAELTSFAASHSVQ